MRAQNLILCKERTLEHLVRRMKIRWNPLLPYDSRTSVGRFQNVCLVMVLLDLMY